MQTQQTPIAFSGNIPKNYDSFLGPMFFEPYAIDLTNRIAKLKPINILEIASGTGRLTKMLSAVIAKGGTIIASDINPAMISYGKAQTKTDSIKWMEIDALSLPFEDNSFDLVVVQFGVMFYSDRVKAFKEARRVLKPGGTFIFNCWDEIKNNPLADITNETLKHFFPIDTPAFYSVPFSYFEESLIKGDLKKSGFENPKIEMVKLTGYSTTASNAAKGLIEGTPTVTAIEDRDKSILPVLIKTLEEKIIARFGNESFHFPMQARVVTSVKE
jgi:ubiquinone/menaquinone biosynthesis C-methylase UbiE